MTKARLELLCPCRQLQSRMPTGDFKGVLEACLDDLKHADMTDIDETRQAKLKSAKDSLKAGLRFLEVFQKIEGVDDV